MIQSMTGYGQATLESEQLRVNAEIKAINAKQADVSLRLSRALTAHELTWRNQIIAGLDRGKITLEVSYELKKATSSTINIESFKSYYRTLQNLAEEVGATTPALFQLALQGPEVIISGNTDLEPNTALPMLEEAIQTALARCRESRIKEGAALASQVMQCLHNIKKALEQVTVLAPARVQAMREKLLSGFKALAQEVDESRMAQELLYYVERQDIAEEQVRLDQHLISFEEAMQSSRPVGKKLGFIAQEIGREINTIGAKANDISIQQEVIHMKDELEKIKEQLQNIL